MLAGLMLLVSLWTSPHFCAAPCEVKWRVQLAYPAVRGELCLHLESDSLNVSTGCWTIDGTAKVWEKKWVDLGAGTYVAWAEMDGKMVSAKNEIVVTGRD